MTYAGMAAGASGCENARDQSHRADPGRNGRVHQLEPQFTRGLLRGGRREVSSSQPTGALALMAGGERVKKR